MAVHLKTPQAPTRGRFWSKRHVASPATAEEIRSAVKVTSKDKAVVRRVLSELGYGDAASTLEPRRERKSALPDRRQLIADLSSEQAKRSSRKR